ncbi:MAG TPA: hypothetical protein EYF95_08860 [Flavobacteriales bacterium]|nr:hypothetical protein [Flavobacteriales bacterium]
MATHLFDTLQAGAMRAGLTARTKESKAWFKKKIKDMGTVNKKALMKDGATEVTTNPLPGQMIMYFYNPKHRKTLPYYDRFPMTIIIQPAPGGFHGLNLHYLSPGVRARFLDDLMDTAPKNITDKTRLKITYDKLNATKKYKEFAPCFKHYLGSHIKSQMARVPMTEWEMAVFLPTESFVKVRAETVWRYSRKQYSGK